MKISLVGVAAAATSWAPGEVVGKSVSPAFVGEQQPRRGTGPTKIVEECAHVCPHIWGSIYDLPCRYHAQSATNVLVRIDCRAATTCQAVDIALATYSRLHAAVAVHGSPRPPKCPQPCSPQKDVPPPQYFYRNGQNNHRRVIAPGRGHLIFSLY